MRKPKVQPTHSMLKQVWHQNSKYNKNDTFINLWVYILMKH